MSVIKVRHREYSQTPTEAIIETLVGIKGVLSRSIEIDWVVSPSSVYVLPFNGYDWRPTVFERSNQLVNSFSPLLLEQIITDRFSELTDIKYAIAQKVPMHIFGVNKYIAIRTAAYANFSELLGELDE